MNEKELKLLKQLGHVPQSTQPPANPKSAPYHCFANGFMTYDDPVLPTGHHNPHAAQLASQKYQSASGSRNNATPSKSAYFTSSASERPQSHATNSKKSESQLGKDQSTTNLQQPLVPNERAVLAELEEKLLGIYRPCL